jgi:hypothetical protein
MSNASSRENEMTVGLDVGDKYVHACFLDHYGIHEKASLCQYLNADSESLIAPPR